MKITTGTKAYELLRLLNYVGEYPRRSLNIIAENAGWTKRVVKMLLDEEYIRLLKRGRSIRSLGITEKGLRAIAEQRCRLNGSSASVPLLRLHKIAETAAMIQRTGAAIYPDEKPAWPPATSDGLGPGSNIFWTSREIREKTPIHYSQCTGLYLGGEACAVYNMQNRPMSWAERTECNAKAQLSRAVRQPCNSAILLGRTMADLNHILQAEQEGNRRLHCGCGYPNMYFLSMTETPDLLLRLMAAPHWQAKLVNALLTEEEQAKRLLSIENDGKIALGEGDIPVMLAFDCNLPRLWRHCLAVHTVPSLRTAVVCFPYQAEVLAGYFGEAVTILVVAPERLEMLLYENFSA